MPTIEELQAQLQERINKLDEERRAYADQHAKEQAELRIIAEAQRAQQVADIKAAEERALARKTAEKKAEEERLRKAQEERIVMEQKQNALDEVLRRQREKLAWLEEQISNAEFLEEQHKKRLDSEKAFQDVPPEETNPEAALGTEGTTPETPLMSQHLRKILRQASRED